jgi:hypothetical protein
MESRTLLSLRPKLGVLACSGFLRALDPLGIFYFAIKSSSMSFWQTTVSRPERRIMLPEVCIEHVSFALIWGAFPL